MQLNRLHFRHDHTFSSLFADLSRLNGRKDEVGPLFSDHGTKSLL